MIDGFLGALAVLLVVPAGWRGVWIPTAVVVVAVVGLAGFLHWTIRRRDRRVEALLRQLDERPEEAAAG